MIDYVAVLSGYQAEATIKLLAKEIKKDLRKFVKTSDKSTFEEVFEDWEISLDQTSLIGRIYQAYKAFDCGTDFLIIKVIF